jgi:hypothetical protein
MVFFAGVAGYLIYTNQAALAAPPTGGDRDWVDLLIRSLKPIGAIAVLLSICVYAIKWFGGWADRHASEEFRLKRLQLDLQRAHWFTELAFQWKDEFGEPIPAEVADKLAANLFVSDDHTHESPTYESLATLLLGGAKLVKLSPEGVELEMPGKQLRKAVKRAAEPKTNGEPKGGG